MSEAMKAFADVYDEYLTATAPGSSVDVDVLLDIIRRLKAARLKVRRERGLDD